MTVAYDFYITRNIAEGNVVLSLRAWNLYFGIINLHKERNIWL